MEKVYKPGGDVRLTLLTSCHSGCNFCHLEGHKSEGELGTLNEALSGWKDPSLRHIPLESRLEQTGRLVGRQDVVMAIQITQELGLGRLHLTGGEPTLHPHLVSIIQTIKQAGLTTGITTHGEYGPDLTEKLITAGVNSINYSMHAATPEDYLMMDLVAQRYPKENGLKYAGGRLAQKKTNILLANRYQNERPDFRAKVNSVVQSYDATMRVVEWCLGNDIDLRLQRDLNNKETSYKVILDILDQIGAKPIRQELAELDSSGAGITYQLPSEKKLKVKFFGDIYVDEMCNDCILMDTENCRERFYGVRVEKDKVITCIDVLEAGRTSFDHQQFIEEARSGQGVPGRIKEQYKPLSKNS